MKYIVELKYTNPSHEHVSLRRRVESRNAIVEANTSEEAILRASKQQRALGFKVESASIVESSHDPDKREAGYKMSPAVKAAQKKSDELSKVEKPVQAGTLAAQRRREKMKEKVELDEARLPHVATFVLLKRHIENKSLRDAIHIPVNVAHGDKSHKEKLVKKIGAEKAAMYKLHGVFPRKIDEEVEQIDEGKGYSPGWMLKKDLKLGKKLKDKINLAKKRQASYGKPNAGISATARLAKEEVEQVDEIVEETNFRRPSMREIDAALDAEKKGNPGPANKLRDIMRKRAQSSGQSSATSPSPERKFPVYEPGRKYVGDSVELDGPVIDENNLKSLKKEDTEINYIEEKLTAADPASKWISDFVKSKNPKFAGKSKKERIQQALGAYYAAKRGTNEEVEPVTEAKVNVNDPKKTKVQLALNKIKSRKMVNMQPTLDTEKK